MLLRAKSRTRIPVSCVEQGRWSHRSREFSPDSYSPSFLRTSKSRAVSRNLAACGKAHSDQGAVWADVEESMELVSASSPTMAMHDAVDQRRESIDSYVEALPYPEDTRGVIACKRRSKSAAVPLYLVGVLY